MSESAVIHEGDVVALIAESKADRFETLSKAWHDACEEKDAQAEEYMKLRQTNIDLQLQVNKLREERDRAR